MTDFRITVEPRKKRRVRELETDVDIRTTAVWAELEPVLRSGRITLGVIASALRASYAQGYADCLSDEGVSLYADHGYQVERR